MSNIPDYNIPDPKEPNPDKPIDQQFLVAGTFEQEVLASYHPDRHRHFNWAMRFIMKPCLFLFVLGLNWWWDKNVLQILWQTGRTGAGFHLGDPVLIALITTSVANFLVLIHIVAKHLFPEHEKSSKSKISN